MKQESEETSQFLYSVPITDKVQGQSPIFRHPLAKDRLISIPQNYTSLAVFWHQIVAKYSERKAIEDLTYHDFDQMAHRVGSWLRKNNHLKIYLQSKNCAEWLMTEIGCWIYGIVNIPLYETLGKQSTSHILEVTSGTCIFINEKLVEKFKAVIENNPFKVNELVVIGSLPGEKKQEIEKIGVKVTQFSTILNHDIEEKPQLDLNQHLSYIFTSGTTGVPKGVVYTHRMIIAQILTLLRGQIVPMKEGDVHLSFLPLAHIYERGIDWLLFGKGGRIRFMEGPVTEILKQMGRVKPNFFSSVPRLMNRLYPLLKSMYEKDKNKEKIKALFGGQIRFIVSASAPVSNQILSFFREVLECEIIQIYGQTETLGGTLLTNSKHANPGHVGGPHQAVQVKLVDVPQMDYLTTHEPPRGEVCMRGEPIFSEYLNNPEMTKEVLDEKGWNHSGDIGELCPDGGFKIIDRKKNIYKLSQGEYIAPEKIQNIYARVKFIAQTFVYGDSLKDYNIAFIHPSLDLLPLVAKSLGIEEVDPVKLCENKKVINFFLEEMLKQGKSDGLFGFEQIKKIKILPIPFMEVGILTDTMKLQRNIAKNILKVQIEELYAAD